MQSLWRVLGLSVSIAEPLEGRYADDSVECPGSEPETLPHVVEKEISFHLPLLSYGWRETAQSHSISLTLLPPSPSSVLDIFPSFPPLPLSLPATLTQHVSTDVHTDPAVPSFTQYLTTQPTSTPTRTK